MTIRNALSLLAPGSLISALRIARHWAAAGRLLRTGVQVQPSGGDAAQPYDPLLLHSTRIFLARIRRVSGADSTPAVRVVAAAFLQFRHMGWHCDLHLSASAPPTAARLDLWGVPVLTAGEPSTDLRPIAESGGKLRQISARWPAETDPTVARIEAGADLDCDLRHRLEQLGGVSSILKPGAWVLLKANFNSHHAPPASTAFDMLDALIRLLRQTGISEIALGECSAIALGRTRRVLERIGLSRWADVNDVQLRCFDEEGWQVCPVRGRHFHEIIIPACVSDFEHIIYLLCAKTHQLAGVSLGLKMTIGFMHPVQRLELHRDHLVERIADASLALRPDLAVLDARHCFVTGGPLAGTVASPGMLMAARQLEPLEHAGLEILDQHRAVGLDIGSAQLDAAIALHVSSGEGQADHVGE